MKIDFKNSETAKNLMRAFAGESQARNRYTFAASAAKKAGMYVIEGIFNYTAGQEKEHAEIFYNHLKELNGENITVDGAYPVEVYTEPLKLLNAGFKNEYEEYEKIYPSFAKVAEEEGFYAVANSFKMIARIEKTHGDRFRKYADKIEKDKFYKSDVETDWICLNCGHIYKGTAALEKCPVCEHDKGYFLRLEFSPYEG